MPKAHSSRAVVITGAASGIGYATACRMSLDYPRLLLVDRDGDGLRRAANELSANGTAVEIAVVDLADPENIQAVLRQPLSASPAVLVNNAGLGFAATTAETSREQWELTIAVNLSAVFQLCSLALPSMIDAGSGLIVNVSSAGGVVGLRRRAAYCASKAGVIGLTRAIAADHAAEGIRANAIAPGTVDTEWIGRILTDDPTPEATRAAMAARQLDNQMGSPDDVAGGIAFLASPAARFINGSVLMMDGGLTAV